MKTQPHYAGHRKRVRNKFLKSLGAELSDYELLEILLFSSNARSDTKILAKKLITKFGSIEGVVNCDLENLRMIEDVGEATIVQLKVISQIINRILKNRAKSQIILNDWSLVLDYLRNSIKTLNYEVFRVLFLGKNYQLIEEELIEVGDIDFVNISQKLIAKKALIVSASSIVLCHNHPSNNLTPSKSDIDTTNNIIKSLSNFNVKVLDHFIISSSGYYSFRESGLISN